MGITCCTVPEEHQYSFTELNTSPSSQKQTYKISEWPSNDQVISQWMINNRNSSLLIWKPMKSVTEQKYFLGDWNNGVPLGAGLLYAPNRFLLQGQFQSGMPNGKCKIKSIEDKYEFEGKMRDGKAEGEGTYTDLKNKISFEGHWHNSYPKQGNILLLDNKYITCIQFENYMNPKGAIFYQDNRKYTGQINMKRMVPHGSGIVTFPFGSTKFSFEGQFFLGEMHGKGHLWWRDDSEYEGDYIYGKKSGVGKYTYPSKKQHEGFWENGLQQGPGILYSAQKVIEKRGMWKNGSLVTQLSQIQYEKQYTSWYRKFQELRNKTAKQLQQKLNKKPESSNYEEDKEISSIKLFTIHEQNEDIKNSNKQENQIVSSILVDQTK